MVYNEIRRKRISRIPLNIPLETQERTLSSYDNKKTVCFLVQWKLTPKKTFKMFTHP